MKQTGLLMFMVAVLLIGGWLFSGVVSTMSAAGNPQPILLNAQQAVNQAAEQLGQQEQQQQEQQNAQPPVQSTPIWYPVETPTPYVYDPVMTDQEYQALRGYAGKLSITVAALMLPSTMERCLDDMAYCPEFRLLGIFAQQDEGIDWTKATGNIYYDDMIESAVVRLGDAYAGKDTEEVKAALNELARLANELVGIVNGMEAQ